MTRPARVERERVVRKPRPVVAVAIAVSGEDRSAEVVDELAALLREALDSARARRAG